ncbi:hypothetical protein GF324_08645 [bacterium]|nr:hypothetical protein [bacterium]
MPWSGQSFSVTLELLKDTHELVVYRDFHEGSLRVNDRKRGDVTAEYAASRNRDRLGEVLTGGLSAGGFLRSFVISQEQASLLAKPGDLVERIQAVVTASPGDITTRSAMDLLQQSLQSVEAPDLAKGPVKVETAEKRLEERRRAQQQEIHELENLIQQDRRAVEEYEQKRRKTVELRARAQCVRKGILLGEARQLEERLQSSQTIAARLEQLEDDIRERDDVSDFPLETAGRFDTLYGSYREAEALAADAREQYNEAHREVQRLRDELNDRFEDLAEFETTVEADDLIADLRHWRDADKKLSRHTDELQKQRERLASDGIFANRLEQVREKTHDWPDDVEESYTSLLENREELDEERRSLAKKFRRYRWREKSQRAHPAVLIAGAVIVLTALGAGLQWKILDNLYSALLFSGVAVVLLFGLIIAELIDHVVGHMKYGRLLKSTEEQLAVLDRKLDEYIHSLGMEDHATFQSVLHDRHRTAGRGGIYFETKALYQQALEERNAADDRIRPHLESAGMIEPGEDLTLGDINGYLTRMDEFRHRLKQKREIEAKLSQYEETSRKAASRVEKIWSNLLEILKKAGIEADEDGEEWVDAFRVKVRRAQERARALEKKETLKVDLADKDSLIEVQKKLHRYQHLLEELRDVEAADGDADDLRREADEIARDLRDTERDVETEKLHLREVHETLPVRKKELETELNDIEKRLNGLRVQAEAVQLALSEIQSVENDVFGDASRQLNQRIGPILEELLPRWSSTVFDASLQLHASDRESGREVGHDELERVLSAGARDAIYIGARIALSEFLAGGLVDAPYVLDEPFAHLDDQRFEQGMDLLLRQVEQERQVILMTCHAERHQGWLRNLTGDRRAKVNVLEVNA